MENNEMFENRIDLSKLKESVDAIKAEIGKVIVGQHKMIELFLVALLADGHVLIEGVPGVAKTLSAKLLARIIKADFSRIQFTPDLMPSDVLGTSVFNLKDNSFEFKRGPVFSNLILIDEINRAPAKTQAALFEVMEERQVTMDGKTYPMEFPYFVMATQNPIEQEGTYRLPEAQLDRFLFKIGIEYPSQEEEIMILEGHQQRKDMLPVDSINPILSSEQLKEYRDAIFNIHVEHDMLNYIARLVHETRNSPDIYLGASPRASIAMLRTAKAYAAIQGRDFITPEDIKEMTPPILRHRILLSPEKEMEGFDADDIIAQVIDKIEIPR
ncbi:AAA family ATPase [Fulvivirga sedimenti]|uniref:MoxR family ATPase n=1 Tax=Fulvivirga sedimenti TaxID=2879465 RepID=A0A9X1HP25_9BACT|nr:MoxR family ATPase [Fulvivirga sedimenti]MCA6074363.1 MoxR family ATPase [Fulvivirga sedimenti]